jgi:hypothetical protein
MYKNPIIGIKCVTIFAISSILLGIYSFVFFENVPANA